MEFDVQNKYPMILVLLISIIPPPARLILPASCLPRMIPLRYIGIALVVHPGRGDAQVGCFVQ
jgi:hypothetical protein